MSLHIEQCLFRPVKCPKSMFSLHPLHHLHHPAAWQGQVLPPPGGHYAGAGGHQIPRGLDRRIIREMFVRLFANMLARKVCVQGGEFIEENVVKIVSEGRGG